MGNSLLYLAELPRRTDGLALLNRRENAPVLINPQARACYHGEAEEWARSSGG